MTGLLKYIIIVTVLLPQNISAQYCTVIDLAKETGTFTIRDNSSGRIQMFKPDALVGAELKVGDTVNVKFDSMKVTAVKGVSRNYPLLDPFYRDSCCRVASLDTLFKDSVFRVTAKNIASGENIYFNLPASLRPALDTGATVFTHPSHGYAMIASVDSTRKKFYGFPLLQEEMPE